MDTVAEITPTAFLARWPDFRDGNAVLLDVREPHEHGIAHVEGSTNIPMAQVPQRLTELERGKPTVVMCHSGVRSMRVALFLANQGFSAVFNLTGGIEAWASELGTSNPAMETAPR